MSDTKAAISSDPKSRHRTTILVVVLLAVAGVGIYIALRSHAGPSGLGGNWTYDIKSLAVTDPNLVLYRELAPIPIENAISGPRGIAVDANGDIIVVGADGLRVFDPNGVERAELCKPYQDVTCVATNDDGDVVLGFRNRVRQFSKDWRAVTFGPQGRPILRFPEDDSRPVITLNSSAMITSLALSRTGSDVEIFIADAGNRVVWRYNSRGDVLGCIGQKESNRDVSGFVIPSPHFDLAMGRDGLLRVVNPGLHRIETYRPTGDMESFWGTFDNANIAGFCGCCNPTDIAILPDGSFVTSEKGLARVKVYDANGVLRGVVAGAEAFKEGVTGLDLAAGPDGTIYVLDPATKNVRVFVKK